MRIEALRLPTAHIGKQADFYSRILGLELLEHRQGRLVVQAGYTRLTFTAAPVGWRGAYHYAFNIPENQLPAARQWLQARVPLIRSSAGQDEFDFSHWEAHALYFYDAAGNIVELIARHALVNGTTQPFDQAGLLGISEIGLASPAVLGTVEQLAQSIGLDVFRGSLGESFAAVGGETGLFIVVREGREWFPDTGVLADALPLAVTVGTDDGRRFDVSGPPYQVTPA
jgi:catechol-2,3-dioxygenase